MKYALMVNYDYASGNDSDWVYVNAAGMESSMPKMYEDFDSALSGCDSLDATEQRTVEGCRVLV